MKRLLLTLATLLALGAPALAQNTQCPDRPLGDSTNACANTRFVQSNGNSGSANVKSSPYNAKGDGIKGTDGAITAATTSFTSAGASFTVSDVGKLIVIQGAGSNAVVGAPRAPFATTIAAVNSATNVTLTAPVTATVSGATYQYCTDDTAGIQLAINSSFGGIYFPKGRYCISGAGLTGTSDKFWVGDGTGISIITAAAKPTTNFIIFNAKSNVQLRDLTFDGFEMLYDFNSGTFPTILPIIYYVGGSNLKVVRTEFLGWDTDGLLTNTAYNITVANSYFTRSTQSSGHLNGGVTGSDGAMTSGSNVFTSASAAFVPGDVGKMMIVEGAGSGGITLVGSIIARTSATQVSLSNKAGTTVAAVRYQYAAAGSQVSVTGLEMSGTGTVDANNLRDFSVYGNVITNGSIGISGHDGSVTNNSISGHSFGAGIHTQGLASNFNIAITGNQVTRGYVMQDTAGAYPGGIENWAAGSTVAANTSSYNTGPGISIGGKTVVSGNTVYNNGQGNNIAITAVGFGGIALFWQDATFNSNGTLVVGNRSYDNQTPKTQEYGYTENSNLGVGCPGACQGTNISLVSNDFSGNLTANTLLQPLTSRSSDQASTVTIQAGGFSGGTFTTPTINTGAITGANPLTVLNVGSGAFTLQIRPNTTMTGNHILDLVMGDADRVLTMAANVTFSGPFVTSGGSTLQFTTSGATNITLPAVTDTAAVLGTAQTFTAKETFNIGSTIASATAANLDDINVQAATTTITGNTGSPITRLAKVGIYRPTLTDASAVTVTDAASLYIDNSPAQAGSVTITNPWSLLVGSGATKLQATTINAALTYGGVTLSNAVTGTGKMVLDASPNITGGATFSSSSTWGTGSGQVLNIVNGGNSGTAGGAGIYFQNNSVLNTAIGNKSVILGGAYDATSLLYAGTSWQISTAGTNAITISNVQAVAFPGVGTTASAANAFLDNAASNNLLRSTSSLRYKTDVAALSWWEALPALALTPISFHSLASADDPTRRFEGLAAEQVAQHFPQFVNYDEQGRPDGVQYDRIAAVPMLLMIKLQTGAIVVLFFLFGIALIIRRRRA